MNAAGTDSRTDRPLQRRATIRVDQFQPFESRAGIDTVIRLTFPYDAELVGHLKHFLVNHKDEAVDPGQHKCWFCEAAIWPALKEELLFIGYRIEEHRHG